MSDFFMEPASVFPFAGSKIEIARAQAPLDVSGPRVSGGGALPLRVNPWPLFK